MPPPFFFISLNFILYLFTIFSRFAFLKKKKNQTVKLIPPPLLIKISFLNFSFRKAKYKVWLKREYRAISTAALSHPPTLFFSCSCQSTCNYTFSFSHARTYPHEATAAHSFIKQTDPFLEKPLCLHSNWCMIVSTVTKQLLYYSGVEPGGGDVTMYAFFFVVARTLKYIRIYLRT